MKIPKIENIGFIGIILMVILAFFYIILGLSGMMAILGIMLFFVVPFYLMLNNLELGQDEKLILSFLIGAGLFPSLAYWLGLFISFKISIFIAFAVLVAAGFAARKYLDSKAKKSAAKVFSK